MTRKLVFLAAILAATFSAGAWAEKPPNPPQPQAQPGQPVNPAPQAQPAATPSAAASPPAQCPPTGQKISVAIYPIKPAGADTSLAAAMSQLLGAKLTPSPKLRVIEEAMLKTVMERQALNVSDACDDTSCQVEIGKLVKAQKMITGGISKLGSKYILSLNLVDIQTGATEFSTEDQCACSEDQLDQLVEVAAAKVRNYFCERMPIPIIAQVQLSPSATPGAIPSVIPNPENRATFYLHNSLPILNQIGGTSRTVFILDGEKLGTLMKDGCIAKYILPGNHIGKYGPYKLNFSAESGEKYYFEIKDTLLGYFKFEQVSEAQAKRWIQNCEE